MPFLRLDGNRILRDGAPVRLCGVNVGNWLLIEHFMIGLPWTDFKIRQVLCETLGPEAADRFFDTYTDHYFTGADLEFLKAAGFNFIRLPFTYRLLEEDRRPGDYRPEGLARLDSIVRLCRKHETYLLLDLHAAPGCQARDWNSESAFGETYLWTVREFQDRTEGLWRTLAARYRDEPYLFGYEVLGEPVCPDVEVFRALTRRMIRAIRQADPNHVIVIESNEWGRDIASLSDDLFEDPGVMPSLHYYPVQHPPFGRMATYPAVVDGRCYGREELLATLSRSHDDERIRRPMLVGEFGLYHGASHSPAVMAMTEDLLGFFDEKGWSWAVWAYKDVGVMGLLHPKASTPWVEFQRRPETRRLREEFEVRCRAFVEGLRDLAPALSQGAVEHMVREVRRDWHQLALPLVADLLRGRTPDQLADMARSFEFARCDVEMPMLRMLQRHTGLRPDG